MKLMTKLLVMTGFLTMTEAVVAQTATIGYSNGTVERKEGFRISTTDSLGMAIYLTPEKAALLKGARITGISTAFGTTQIANFQLFVTKELGGTPVYSQMLEESFKTDWKDYLFTTPVEIDGPLYIGYTFKNEVHNPLLFDQSVNTPEAVSWAWNGEKWINVSNDGYGVANIRLLVEGVSPFTDLMMKPVDATGYYKAGNSYVFGGQLFNFGTETVNSFEISCQIGSGEPTILNVTDANLVSGTTYDFTLPEHVADEAGNQPLKVTLTKVNGVDTDADMTDNVSELNAYFYPADMERKYLLEMFTGQACGQCPGGHKVIAAAIAGRESEFIEVAHHSGYSPDYFTMEEDMYYTWFYGSGSTYAPGMMLNRLTYTSGLTTPVVQANVAMNVKNAIAAAENEKPYVSVKMYNEFDATTRMGVVTVDVHTYQLPEGDNFCLNLFLTQNNMISGQSGTSGDYAHNHVFRGALNGAFGKTIELAEGKTTRKSVEYTIPDSILSSYDGDGSMGIAWEANVEDMDIVAFVSHLDNYSPVNCQVYNAASIGVTEQLSAIGTPEKALSACTLQTLGNGMVAVNGEFNQLKVYNTTGVEVKTLAADEASFTLQPGMYIIRILTKENTVVAKKLIVK